MKAPTLHANEEHVLPPLAGNEGALLAATLQERVSRHGRTHAHALDFIEAELGALRDVIALELAEDAPDAVCQLQLGSLLTLRWEHRGSWRGQLTGASCQHAARKVGEEGGVPTFRTMSSWPFLEQIASVKVPPRSMAIRARGWPLSVEAAMMASRSGECGCRRVIPTTATATGGGL